MSRATSAITRVPKGAATRIAVVIAAVTVGSLLITTGSRAAFSSTAANGSNSWSAGTVVLTDDDADSVLFTLTNLSPGDGGTECINVTYTGSLTADVKLYGTVGGTGLATYLDTTIEIGTGAAGGATGDCTGFTPTSTIFPTAALSSFASSHTSFTNGLGGFTGATNPTTRSYRITTAVADNNLAQGLTATATFTWEAQDQ